MGDYLRTNYGGRPLVFGDEERDPMYDPMRLHFTKAEMFAIRNPSQIRAGKAYLNVHTFRNLRDRAYRYDLGVDRVPDPQAQVFIAVSDPYEGHEKHLPGTLWVATANRYGVSRRSLADMGVWNSPNAYKNYSNYLLDLYDLLDDDIAITGWGR